MNPHVLSGPILRRSEKTEIYVWLALTQASKVVIGKVFKSNNLNNSIGEGSQPTLSFGKGLHVVLLKITPKETTTFPEDEILCYDISIDGEALSKTSLGKSINYPPYSLPSFFIQSEETQLNVLFGSCRKIHGPGQDCLTRGDDVIAEHSQAIDKRPTALFLGGDQVYADDVSSVVMPSIIKLAGDLVGSEETIHGEETNNSYTFGSRGQMLKAIGLEDLSYYPDNHVMKFGEYAALYCMSWNPDVWPDTILEDAENKVNHVNDFIIEGQSDKSKEVKEKLKRHKAEIPLVKNYMDGLTSVRRLLANVPTYMIFDDHEITDDWNITYEWRERMMAHELGSQLLSNGLTAYWLFQAWGNNPKAFNERFIMVMSDYTLSLVSSKKFTHEDFQAFYGLNGIGFPKWDFMTPTYPQALFIDTRTKRYFELRDDVVEVSDILEKVKDMIANKTNKVINFALKLGHKFLPGQEGKGVERLPPRLVSPYHFKTLKELFGKELNQQTFFLVTATPVFGLQRFEDIQRQGNRWNSPYANDNESWAANYSGYFDLLKFLSEELKAKHCIILSGDVHYGFINQCELNFKGELELKNNLNFTQITSSSLKNNAKDELGGLARSVIEELEENMEPWKSYKDIEWVENRYYFGIKENQSSTHKIIIENNLGLLQFYKGELGYKFLFKYDDNTIGESDILPLTLK